MDSHLLGLEFSGRIITVQMVFKAMAVDEIKQGEKQEGSGLVFSLLKLVSPSF